MTFLAQLRPPPERPWYLPLQRAAGTFSLRAINKSTNNNDKTRYKEKIKYSKVVENYIKEIWLGKGNLDVSRLYLHQNTMAFSNIRA